MIKEIFKKENKIYLFLVGFVFVFMFFKIVFIDRLDLNLSDAYYYISLARSLIESGWLYDLTTKPAGPPLTPQNGIVFIYAFFMNLGLHDFATLLMVVEFLLFFVLLALFVLIYKISELQKIDSKVNYLFLLYLSLNFYLYAYWASPVNDGFFALITYLVLYIIFLHNNNFMRRENLSIFFLLLVLSLILSVFRLQGFIVFIAIAGAFLFIKKDIFSTLFFTALFVAGYFFMSYVTKITINDFSFIDSFSTRILDSYSFTFFQSQLIDFLEYVIPSVVFGFPAYHVNNALGVAPSIVFSLVTLGYIIFIFMKSFLKKDFIGFVFSSYILLDFLSVLFFQVVDRYFFISLPLIIFLILRDLSNIKYQKVFLYLLIVFILIGLVARFLNEDRSYIYNEISTTKLTEIIGSNDYYVSSNEHRRVYYLTGKPSITDLSLLENGDVLVVLGSDDFVSKTIDDVVSKYPDSTLRAIDARWDLSYHLNGLDSEAVIVTLKGKI